MATLYSIQESGDRKKVKIERDTNGVVLSVTNNGNQWTGVYTDDEILTMIQSAIEEYFEIIDSN